MNQPSVSMNDTGLKNDLLIRACQGQPTPRTPVWMMRQAGRYLPEYQAVRAKADFLAMCRTPELATEVTLQPVDIIGVDAAIIFSDILVVPEAMGMKVTFHDGVGPVFDHPIDGPREIQALEPVVVEEKLGYVLEALEMTKRALDGRVPLIGFAGAPWTIAGYMVEGRSSKTFAKVKAMRYTRPDLLHQLLDRLSHVVSDFLLAQIDAGADVVQLFDSWAGMLTPDDFRVFSLPYLKKIVDRVSVTGVPIIVFARNAGHSFAELSQIGAQVLSVSWSEELAAAKAAVQGRVVLQGNLDPCALLGPIDSLRQEVIAVLDCMGHNPSHIFNLGHGILPNTPVDHARALIDIVKEESVRYHG